MKLLLIALISFCSTVTFAVEDSTNTTVQRDSIVSFAKEYIGTPYLWGGTTTKGFDCSGFVYYVFEHFGIHVSRTSRGYKDKGTKIELQESRPGDIILFTGTNAQVRQIGHVGIILQNNNGVVDFIHSSSSKKHFGVTVTRYNESGYTKRFLNVINILS